LKRIDYLFGVRKKETGALLGHFLTIGGIRVLNIVLGATGQIGSLLVRRLLELHQPVRAVVRDEKKAAWLGESGVPVAAADYFDCDSLKRAFRGGTSAFLLTPENPASEDVLRDTASILRNYRDAIIDSGVERIVGLSSFGARHPSGTGNLLMSHMIEHAFADLNIEQVFVRPAYYYSNWMGYVDIVKNDGILPTFFPPELKISMIAPCDVAGFIADIIAGRLEYRRIFEIAGPEPYSSFDVAEAFGRVLNKAVTPVQIPRNEWQRALEQAGFSPSGTENLALMTDAVITGKTSAEFDVFRQNTSVWEYFERL
jgi:uncharacterized protein YbjT (DUF2867 family)